MLPEHASFRCRLFALLFWVGVFGLVFGCVLVGSAYARANDAQASLEKALDAGDLMAVRSALQTGAKLNARYQGRGLTPLHQAVASMSLKYIAGRLPFTDAERTIIEICSFLLASGAVISPSDATILHFPSFTGMSNVVNLLLANGADANGSDSNGATPSVLAMQYGNEHIVELLQRHGADPLHLAEKEQLKLIQAAREGDIQAIKIQLAEGATINGRTSDGKTPLTEAIGRGFGDIVLWLLENGADPNLSGGGFPGGPPLIHAVWRRSLDRYEIVDALLSHGAHVSAPDPCRCSQCGVWSRAPALARV